ncbi:acyl--CoA ligase [Paraburkholderia sp. Tr-20389]|uniref:AMP-binding protein n=1 Tax=Paraburkholderia sp. Tr-20389 TaxID=2703903 RepID=UPI0019801C87|nr:class I adenylate-forming enzyme family protein [Paraburkholderia sp. Tr-20389]MBN3758346.1 acyl--CoA ligase [Paraburkholderia sp. Tr-20389]
MMSLPAWTSLVHIQLLGEIAHEFGIDVELDEAYRLDTFERLHAWVESRTPAPDSECPWTSSYGNIGSLFTARATESTSRPFLIFPKEELEYDYATCHRLASAAADRLESAGLERGDRLALVLSNSPAFLIYYFAAHLLGVVVVPINPALRAQEVAYIVGNSGSRLTLFDPALADLRGQVRECGLDVGLELADAHSGFGLDALNIDNARTRDACTEIRPDDVAAILYTSGTTGLPKGVELTHRNFLCDSKALVDWFQFEPQTRTLCVLPMFHNNGQVITLLSPLWVGGSTVIVEPRSALMSFWKLIARYRVEWTSVMPAFLTAFLEHRMPRSDTTLKGIVCGGQVLLPEMREQFETVYRVAVFEGYGLTETTSFATMNGFPAARRVAGSIGAALPGNQVSIVDEYGTQVMHGEVGQILIRGANVAPRYFHLPELSAERFRDGWLHTGDYGYRDTDGNFFFSTRLDDLIIKGGENIYPAEIENVLHGCPDVVECAAVGVPDHVLGQDICVYVRRRDDSALDADGVRTYLSTRIAPFKQPRHVAFVGRDCALAELPKGPTRKILRRTLRDHFAAHGVGTGQVTNP